MQQQFLSMSPMTQEAFGSLDRAPHGILGLNTPTTSSMLAVLNDPFPSTNTNGNPFSPTSFFMETSPTSNGDSFTDFQQTRPDPFDHNVFSGELAIPATNTGSTSPETSDTDKSATEAAPSIKSENA
jgi:regulatory factor X, other